MSSHDPLCPVFHVEECDCPDDACLTYCQCDLIAKVRADEREKAAQRMSEHVAESSAGVAPKVVRPVIDHD